MKSLDDHIDEFTMPFGKFKDCYLEEIELEYLEWLLDNSEYLNKWQEKLIKTFLERDENVEILESIKEQKSFEDSEAERRVNEIYGYF